MWVKSQDGESLLNMDNVTGIFLEKIKKPNCHGLFLDELKHVNIIADSAFRSGGVCLGQYPTVERAKELLNDLYNSMMMNEITYRMPEE